MINYYKTLLIKFVNFYIFLFVDKSRRAEISALKKSFKKALEKAQKETEKYKENYFLLRGKNAGMFRINLSFFLPLILYKNSF